MESLPQSWGKSVAVHYELINMKEKIYIKSYFVYNEKKTKHTKWRKRQWITAASERIQKKL